MNRACGSALQEVLSVMSTYWFKQPVYFRAKLIVPLIFAFLTAVCVLVKFCGCLLSITFWECTG